MVSTINIQRPSYSTTAEGYQTVTYTSIVKDLSAAVQPTASSLVRFYYQWNEQTSHLVLTNREIAVLNGDIVTWAGPSLIVNGILNLNNYGKVWVIPCFIYQGIA